MNTLGLAAPSPERLHGLDALRGGALLLGVVLHLCMAWMPGAQYWWIVSDSHQSPLLSGLFYVIHQFRMPLFFVLAGYFGRLQLERLGWRGFVADRRRRILMPLLSFWFPVFAAIVAVIIWGAWLKAGGQLPAEPEGGPAFTPDDFPLTHLWFLYVLLLAYVGALLLRGVLALVDRRGILAGLADRLICGLLRPWAAFWLALPVAACLSVTAKWYAWFGIPTPDQSLYPNLAASVGFGVAFGFGWLLQRQRDLLQRIQQLTHMHLLLALLATGGCLAAVGLTPTLQAAPSGPLTQAYALGYAIAGWAWTLALIGLALRHASTYSPTRRYLADASYWIYIVHLPLVMAAQVIASQINAPLWIEFPLALAACLALMLASYHWLVRGRWIGNMLNGRRPRKNPAESAPATASAS